MVLSARSASRVALPSDQLVVDDPVERLDVVHVGRQQVDPVRDQPVAVEALGHHVAGAEQRGALDPVGLPSSRRRIRRCGGSGS